MKRQLAIFGSLFLWSTAHHLFAATPGKIPTVVVRPSKLTEISQLLIYPAVVEAKVHAIILAEADGVVRKLHANLGQPIKAGKRLITIQQMDPIFQYAPVSTITPVSGVVSELSVTEGTLVTKGQRLASVTDPNHLKVMVEIPAKDLEKLRESGVGQLETPALGEKLELKLLGISPTVDPATGTATAELTPDSPSVRRLRQGMVGKVTFRAGLHHGFIVPEDALIESQNQTFLRIVADGKAKKIPVKVGDRMRGKAEITQGLEEGYQVVERTSGYVADGEAVNIEEAKEELKN